MLWTPFLSWGRCILLPCAVTFAINLAVSNSSEYGGVANATAVALAQVGAALTSCDLDLSLLCTSFW